MHLNYHDPALWLSYRSACDAVARNKGIERKFLEFFNHKPTLDIVDVGAGTGANFRYYFDHIRQNQRWTFIEKNAQLIEEAKACIAHFAQQKGYHLEQKHSNLMHISAGDKQASIKIIQGCLGDIEHLVSLPDADVVTANAVFDLISYEQFDALVRKLKKEYVCLLSTLNYYETSFLPFSDTDARFIRWYHMHMKRPQQFGIAMGPDCCEEMLDLLHQQGMIIEQEASQWHITRNNTAMHHFLLSFMEDAIHKLNLAACEKEAFDQWMDKRKKLCRERRLEIYVDHNDIFAYPD